MARRTTDIVYAVTGQSIVHRFVQGVPSACTFAVFEDGEDDDATAAFSGTATVDTVNTTVDAASGSAQTDPYRINLAATTAIEVGRKYRLEENGRLVWVEVREIVSGDYVRIRHALTGDWTTAATLKSTYATSAIDATFVAAEDNISDHADPNPSYRMRLAATIDGGTIVEYEFFDVVRAAIAADVSMADVATRWPGLMDGELPREYRSDRGASLLGAADRIVRARLHSIGLNDAGLRDHEALDEYTILVCRRLLAEAGMTPLGFADDAPAFLELATAGEERWFEQHFAVTNKHAVDVATGGDSSRPAAHALWSK